MRTGTISTTRMPMVKWPQNTASPFMKTYKNLYDKIYRMDNLLLAWRKAKKGKTRRLDVKIFEKDIERKLVNLHNELKSQTYFPQPLKAFVIRDPKTRLIHKSDFRDRIVHHALVRVL